MSTSRAVVALLALASAGAWACQPEATHTDPPNVDAHPDAVVVDFYAGAQPSAVCSGTLLSANIVLTAAHCADGSRGAWVKLADGGQSAQVARIMVYDWTNDMRNYAEKNPDSNVVSTHGNPGSVEARPSNEKLQELSKRNDNPIIVASCFSNARIEGNYTATPEQNSQWNSNASQMADDAGVSRDRVYGCTGEAAATGGGSGIACDGAWRTAGGRELDSSEMQKSSLRNCSVKNRNSAGAWTGYSCD